MTLHTSFFGSSIFQKVSPEQKKADARKAELRRPVGRNVVPKRPEPRRSTEERPGLESRSSSLSRSSSTSGSSSGTSSPTFEEPPSRSPPPPPPEWCPPRDPYPPPPPEHAATFPTGSPASSRPTSPSRSPSLKSSIRSSTSPSRARGKSAEVRRVKFEDGTSPEPGKAIPSIPAEIFDRIAYYLQHVHMECNGVCDTCRLRDISSSAKACRSWHSGMAPNLYRKIFITGADSWGTNRRTNTKYGGRLIELRRTLTAHPEYAALVTELTITEYDKTGMSKSDLRKAQDIITSVVALCPNLERLRGVSYPSYNYNSKLKDMHPVHRVLTSRPCLKEHFWSIDAPEALQLTHVEAFGRIHAEWSSLETLVLQGGKNGSGGLNHLAFWDLFNRLPNLKKVMIARFHDYEFDSNTLLALPPLDALRLERLPGINDAGLAHYVKRAAAASLQTLALLHLELHDLATVAAVLTLRRLQKLTLQQTASPQPQHHAAAAAAPEQQPLASASLRALHWDVLVPGPANASLAQAIHAGRFPALRALRAPADHHGILQTVCAPRSSIAVPGDVASAKRGERGLAQARVRAEQRLRAARASVFMTVKFTPPPAPPDTSVRDAMPAALDPARLHFGLRPARRHTEFERTTEDLGDRYHDWKDWDPDVREERTRMKKGDEITVELPAFMGDLASKVVYSLDPDVPDSPEAVIRLRDIVPEEGAAGEGRPVVEDADADPGVCDGRWNANGTKAIHKWQHTARRRRCAGQKTSLEDLF